MNNRARSPFGARGSASRFGVGTLLVLVVLGVAAACSQRFQRELDREIDRLYRPAVADVCRDDADRLCGGAGSGGGRAATCLAQHEKELSAECREVVSGREAVRTACTSDLVNLCKEPANRPQLRLQCLERRRDKLTARCGDALDEYKADL